MIDLAQIFINTAKRKNGDQRTISNDGLMFLITSGGWPVLEVMTIFDLSFLADKK